jgi:predicted Zn-dependent protease with MMP-like domain
VSSNWEHLLQLARAEVSATLAAFPKPLRAAVENLPITYERMPNQALVEDGVDEDTLGLFVGDDWANSEPGHNPIPSQVILFLENIRDYAEGDDGVYREEVRTTLLHELGHYLGLDEIDLEERGLD